MTSIAERIVAFGHPVAVRDRPAGIYFLLLGSELVYVGQSVDVETRVAMHIRQREKTFDRAFWIAVPVADLLAYESAFVRALDPPGNFWACADDSRDAEILARFGLEPDPDARRRFESRRRTRWVAPGTYGRTDRELRDSRAFQRARARRLWRAVDEILAVRHGAENVA